MESEAVPSALGDTVAKSQGVKLSANLPGLLVRTRFKWQARRIQNEICDEIKRLAIEHRVLIQSLYGERCIVTETSKHSRGHYTVEISFSTERMDTEDAHTMAASLQQFVMGTPERVACSFHFDFDDGTEQVTDDHRLGTEDGVELFALGVMLDPSVITSSAPSIDDAATIAA